MFRFTQEWTSGSYNQSLAKITSLVQLCVFCTDVNVMAAYSDCNRRIYIRYGIEKKAILIGNKVT